MDNKKKFFFTQVSAAVVKLSVCLFIAKALSNALFQIFQEKNAAYVVIFVSLILFLLGLSMFLWGKILLLLGILSKEESRGYPFSKPWEKNERDGR